MNKEEKQKIERVHNWLKGKPNLIGNILCKLFGHKRRIVGTMGAWQEEYCSRCKKVLSKKLTK